MKKSLNHYLISLLFLIFIPLLCIGCSRKKDDPYTAEEILQYANELYHQEFEIVSMNEEYKENSSVYYEADYILSPKDNKDFTFSISSNVEQTRHLDRSAYFGPYEKTIFSHYFNDKMNYHKNEIEELAASYDEYIDEYERAFVQEFKDLEKVADFFYKANQIYAFTYDKEISNPLADDSRIPNFVVYKKLKDHEKNLLTKQKSWSLKYLMQHLVKILNMKKSLIDFNMNILKK